MAAPALPVTQQTIADRAKVSCMTVSLALHNHPKISARTRDRVQALARRLGYRLDPLVSAHVSYLRTLNPRYAGRCMAFVCNRLFSEIAKETITPCPRYFEGARARAHALGYGLQYFNLRDAGMTERRLSQILVARGIHGVLIAPLTEGLGVSDVDLDWSAFTAVAIDHVFVEPGLNKVCNDEYSTIGRLIQRLLDAGHRRIGMAMERRMDEHANHFWLAGYQAYQALAAKECRIPHFISAEWNKRAFLAWYLRWRPEAVITINDGIVGWLRAEGVEVPGDVSCATLYWKEDRPELSGFYQYHERMAANAVDLLVSQMDRNERGLPDEEITLLTQAVWRDGSTVAERRRRREVPAPRVWAR